MCHGAILEPGRRNVNGHDLWQGYPRRYARGTLVADERGAFEVHLDFCARCRAEVAVERASLPVTHDAAEPLPPASRRVPSSGAWLVAAAALLTTFVAVGFYVRERGARAAAESELSALQLAADSTDRRIAELDSLGAAGDSLVSLLLAPDARVAPLTGRSEARGHVFWSPLRGRVTASVHGLPELPHGRVYQLWSFTTERTIPLVRLQARDGRILQTFELAPGLVLDWVGITAESAEGTAQPTARALLGGRFGPSR